MSSENHSGRISATEIIGVMLNELIAVAWQKLGLQPDPFSGQIAADLEEAKFTIDVVDAIARQVETKLDDSDKRQLQNAVRDLKMNYLQKVSQG